MKRFIVVGLLVVSLSPLAFGQSNFYKLRNGNEITVNANKLIQAMERACEELRKVQGQFNAMTEQRNSATDYTIVSTQWGVLDPETNAISEPHAEALYAELNAVVSIGGPPIFQGCSRLAQ